MSDPDSTPFANHVAGLEPSPIDRAWIARQLENAGELDDTIAATVSGLLFAQVKR